MADRAHSHFKLGCYLARHARQPDVAFAHQIASELLVAMTGMAGLDALVRYTATYVRSLGDDAAVPADVADLCRLVAKVPGVDLGVLVSTLVPDSRAVQQSLHELVTRIRALADAPPAPPSADLAAWDPFIAALLAVRAGDTQAAADLDGQLARCENSEDWAELASVFRHLQVGEPSPDLLAGLNQIHTAVAARALDALAGRVGIPVALWPAMPLFRLLGDIVAAASGVAWAAQRARESLVDMAGSPDHAALARVLGQILDGQRKPGLTSGLGDPTYRAVVATVLYHIGNGDPEDT